MITDHNKVVAQLIPYEQDSSDPLVDYTEDQIRSGGILEAREQVTLSGKRSGPVVDEDILKSVYEESREERH